jgi:predicted CoA-binding protein
MNQLIDEFISCKKLALVGMSRSDKKFGHMTAKELLAKGYEIFPVHPEAVEINGIACYPNLKSLEGKVEALWISIPPKNVPGVLEEAAEIGLKKIWLQQGSWSNEVQQCIDRLGLPVITKKCILMYAPPVKSFHKFHRTIKGIFGGL